jgi:hypothetical protein
VDSVLPADGAAPCAPIPEKYSEWPSPATLSDLLLTLSPPPGNGAYGRSSFGT